MSEALAQSTFYTKEDYYSLPENIHAEKQIFLMIYGLTLKI